MNHLVHLKKKILPFLVSCTLLITMGCSESSSDFDNNHQPLLENSDPPADPPIESPVTPSSPTSLSANEVSGSVVLTWAVPATGTTPITYNILRSTVSGSGYILLASGVMTTTYLDTTISEGVTYYYITSATNASGTSTYSNQASLTTSVTAPAAPSSLTGTEEGDEINLSWTAASGTGPITYTIYRSTTSGVGYTSMASGLSSTSYSDSTVVNGNTYYYVVTASNSGGVSANSSQFSITASFPTSGLVAHYKFNESSGLTVSDRAGVSSDTGTLMNGTLLSPGKSENGLDFDGVDDYVSISESAELSISAKQISLCMWLKFSSTGTWQTGLVKINQSGTHVAPYFLYMLGVNSANQPRFFLGLGGAASFNDILSPDAMVNGQWYHIVGVYDGTNMKIYVNGTLKNTEAETRNMTTKSSPLRIGAGGTTNEPLKGTVDHVRIYNRPLTATDVTAIYNYELNLP